MSESSIEVLDEEEDVVNSSCATGAAPAASGCATGAFTASGAGNKSSRALA